MLKSIVSFDHNLIVSIYNSTHNNFLDFIMPFFTTLGDNGLIWIFFSFLLLFFKKYRNVGWLCLFSLLLSTLFVEVLIKPLVARPRPFVDLKVMNLLVKPLTSYSFPSGHTSASFAFTGIIFARLPRYLVASLILAILISFSRIYLFMHYPFDVLVGILVGLFCSFVVIKIAKLVNNNTR